MAPQKDAPPKNDKDPKNDKNPKNPKNDTDPKNDNTQKQPTKVKVNTDILREQSVRFGLWGQYLLDKAYPLKSAKIVAGTFPDGKTFESTVNDRIVSLVKNAEMIGHLLKEIGHNMALIATDYDSTEDDNKKDVERAQNFVTDVSQYAPEATKTVPQTTPDVSVSPPM